MMRQRCIAAIARLVTGARACQHAVGVPAQLRDLFFVHRLPRDQRAARGFDRAPLLLDIRKAIIGDDDFQVPSVVLKWRTL